VVAVASNDSGGISIETSGWAAMLWNQPGTFGEPPAVPAAM
jgi:hypothetical protein